MHPPRPDERIGIGEPDVAALVVGKVEVVASERLLDPLWHPNQRWPLDILPDARIGLCGYDWRVNQPPR